MKFNSLRFRLVITAGLVLVIFFVIVGFVLEQAFERSVEQALKEKLRIQIYALLSVAEMDKALRLTMPELLREPRFNHPASGLYAMIHLSDESLVWRSPSAVGIDFPMPENLPQGKFVFQKTPKFYVLHYAVLWESQDKFQRAYIFTVAEDAPIVDQQVVHFRMILMRWLSAAVFLLLLIQIVLLRWGLKPLNRIGHDLKLIEKGVKPRLDGSYPSELEGLVNSLNGLIQSERAHMERYRNTLADLAHSLKTPLAILQGSVNKDAMEPKIIQMQISRMNDIVEYQLQKAAAKGQKKITGRTDLVKVTQKIIGSLEKVYHDKVIDFSSNLPETCPVYCEEGDLYEIIGNLLDNAAKWCRHQVNVSLKTLNDSDYSIVLIIEDDGPGIAANKIQHILQRGMRADENTAGHGIGMAVVNELLGLLNGKLVAAKSEDLGGMQWQVFLP
ncbi:ATP-binding protein [methane-oxidizing endosymbiont of Gigantopelta aegis]|uniref:ATP-binding protein n=1 Tax=methane-oxidizing endosymbiont of Gigantopelta aegis TaxID=2794938 RepID=UPI0018DD92E5|nr:ATP-binding protein [methane-oxidizing endosymbiont of Gigantopelta aegis]